jgi:hypothetical protein
MGDGIPLSLLAHELAHALVARRAGVAVESITFWLSGEAGNPTAALWIALVGSLTSLALGGVFAAVTSALRGAGAPRSWPSRGLAGEDLVTLSPDEPLADLLGRVSARRPEPVCRPWIRLARSCAVDVDGAGREPSWTA